MVRNGGLKIRKGVFYIGGKAFSSYLFNTKYQTDTTENPAYKYAFSLKGVSTQAAFSFYHTTTFQMQSDVIRLVDH
jgi:hypothetical protein